MMLMSMVLPKVVSSILRLWLMAYDVLTFPACVLIYKPWIRRALDKKVRARIVERQVACSILVYA